ncbi:hypothetical protein [Streptomyces sp. A0592]|uniref:hypothetical protein n=1 Tax=Streptomyces sp. A0592 TaxID=2563099 RepID=UPI00109E460E|nr:hypothetical protein [Streptomyces sp. A0592]THA75726.1 hypothetical protein E6U81_36450 [Streptomyces sp. A0592]
MPNRRLRRQRHVGHPAPRGEQLRDEHGHLVLRSPQQFKALGHPVRHRMVNVLREAGLVRLAETRRVRGGTEQYFALVSKGFTLHQDAAVGPEFLINAALGEMLPSPPGQASHTVLRHLWLTDAEAQALERRLRTMVDEPHPTVPARGEPYGLLVSLFRADVPNLPPDDAAAPAGSASS